ncbi:MAG: HDIG domain-containing protein [Verrucomicrobia bacterium]|nr:HDIG domain-containing protein [Verrucomicrobiota bacterium]MBU1735310.1 HDIG domain-containing protein [Verrucomicrobiota bacterium]MBU1858163.1 HDIG domain-containing protein [Verrucomicrobiota bacterium]
MIFELSKLFLKDTKKRLRPSDQAPDKGVLAFVNKPAMGLVYWLLVWLAAFLLQMVPTLQEVGNGIGPAHHSLGVGGPIRLVPGRASSVTVVAAIDFHYLDNKQPARATSVRFNSEGQVRPNLMLVPAGTVLVQRGQKVDAETIEKIRGYQAQIKDNESFLNRLKKLAGDGILLFLGLIVTAAMFRFVGLGGSPAEPGASGKAWVPSRTISQNSMILLFLLVSLLSLAPVKWLLWMDFDRLPWLVPLVDALMPLALAPLLMSILINPLAGMVVGFWVSFAATVLADYRIGVFVTGLIVTAVVVRFTRAVRTRSTLFRIGLWAGLAGAACAAGFAAIGIPGYELVFSQCLASLASGVFAALIVMLLLPLLEIIFGISTDISLLELSDLEHPLLKRLAIEAPGTYHHSLMVANLTQAAVAAIGGNSLRAGICAYFHDIGKLVKPAFFSENIQYGQNPHDDLSPSMSTLLIISHVKEGVNLALRHKLPRSVVEAIQQHHGSGLVFYFYHKANVQHGEAAPDAVAAAGVKEEDFRYPGPKPQSREIAVLSLADAIEAASRSLEKITPGNMEDLVRDVIDSKLRDGQLDACDLTMAEINTIRRVLILTLSNILHGRVAYPSNENIRPQSADATPSERS